MSDVFTIAKLLQYRELKLEALAGKEGLGRRVCSVQSNRPGLALCGYFDHFGHDRIQIFGNGEISHDRLYTYTGIHRDGSGFFKR